MTFKTTFENYLKAIYGPLELNPVQRSEIEKAFYAGALVAFSSCVAASKPGSVEECNRLLFELHGELIDFGEKILPGFTNYFN